MPSRPVKVGWEMATDPAMRKVVRSGSVDARPEWAHSVHVDARGLEPARWYWYRFKAGSALSPVGRTRTAPGTNASPESLRFAFASCQDWQAGYYPAYQRMAEEDLDLVVHLGDYIYEYGPQPGGPRLHDGPEVSSLESYRNRHALYHTDPALQAAHAAFPWVVTWDDHEVDNNYADEAAEDGATPEAFLRRRANAYQAYWEHMPLRSGPPSGPDMAIYRRLRFGDLAELSMLDTRQYRSDQPCGDGLAASTARWDVVGQQVIMAEVDFAAGPLELFNMDQWDGYVAARDRILRFLGERQPSNPVVITGDIHSSWVCDLKADFADPASPTVGTEFVGTSISSEFPVAFDPLVRAALPDNPHIRFFDGLLRGYVRCRLDRNQWRTDFRVVPTVLTPDAPVSTLASFVVEDGIAGAHPA